LWYLGLDRAKNGVDILVSKDLVEQVVEVRRKSCHIMSVKLVVGSEIFNVVIVYAPQIGLDEDTKRLFLEDLDGVIQSILQTKKLFIGVILMNI